MNEHKSGAFQFNNMIELFNGHIKLSIEEPHEGYVGTRFDWTGKVVQLWWKNTPLCSTELAGSNSFMQGKGFFNEFGISESHWLR